MYIHTTLNLSKKKLHLLYDMCGKACVDLLNVK